MQVDELNRIAALVTTPDGSSGGMRARPRNGVPSPGGDRLDELTRWWAEVVGRQLPQRVEHFWLPHTGTAGPVRSQVVLHRFTAPREAQDAIDWGLATADDAVDDGTDLILLSIPARPDDTAWQVAAAQVLGLDAVEAMGWPTPGMSDRTWIERVTRIRDGLKAVHGNRKDPLRLLQLLEHRELLAGTGLLLQAAARRTPAIIDGPIATTCALLAARLAPAARSWWLAADSGGAVLTRRMLEELRLVAVTDLGLDDGDGTGARLTLQLLETAVLRAQERNDDMEDDAPASDVAEPVAGAEEVGVIEALPAEATPVTEEALVTGRTQEPDAAAIDGADFVSALPDPDFDGGSAFEAIPGPDEQDPPGTVAPGTATSGLASSPDPARDAAHFDAPADGASPVSGVEPDTEAGTPNPPTTATTHSPSTPEAPRAVSHETLADESALPPGPHPGQASGDDRPTGTGERR
ncbi:nicotinate-nucleotide--dimethylbenzimidazole phosphoribosyltransferase [Kineosporia sp. NBRC 101731]|uniref:nicotinate-nucleotide--dimethylbenzimidazole phosphoribosyltransferase n=1 Tax=Kineosporia sp. NBRC 101731 TaxID=3032199 RepID=UPI0025559D77|nr:nicotinate-nucleotide--dimethylbenzimidazole phosphoribosyltransferase [Kineosporia sp. NBRC 101731]